MPDSITYKTDLANLPNMVKSVRCLTDGVFMMISYLASHSYTKRSVFGEGNNSVGYGGINPLVTIYRFSMPCTSLTGSSVV